MPPVSRKPNDRHMHRMASSLLVLSACGYAASTFWQSQSPWAGHAAAFFEAAIVGAVADWFAVTALFRHPLGIPIWHTAIIPKNKDRIGENLANFLCEHFLRSEQIMGKLVQMDFPGRIANWLTQASHAQTLSTRLADAAHWAFDALGNSQVRDFVLTLSRKGLQRIDIAPLIGQILSGMTHERRHQTLLDATLQHMAHWMSRPSLQNKVTEVIAKEVRALRYLGLDQVAARMATAKLIHLISSTVQDMAEDPDHDLRLRFDEFVTRFVTQLQTDPAMALRVADWRDQLLLNPHVSAYVQKLWDDLLHWIRDDLNHPESKLRGGLTQALQSVGERLQHDSALRNWLQTEILRSVPVLTERYREDIRQYVVLRVKAWDAQELSNELETHIGRDLQFIRINGTVVGGLIGLLIHLVTELVKQHG